mgnify:CR=1 FL=1
MFADGETVKRITGASVGFAGPVRLPFYLSTFLPIYADFSVENIINGISGANRDNYHLKNINIARDYKPTEVLDIRKVKNGDICPKCGKHKLQFSRGIEIGHTFKLGTKYSKAMNATFLDDKGNKNFFVMGCYGIGVSRIVAAAIEQSNDQNGIIWHKAIAPYKIVIIPISYEGNVKDVSDKIYKKLSDSTDVLLDDRDERAGVKFKDADLLGIPVRITVSEKTLKENKVEVKHRNIADVKLVDIDSL